ncbi:MAG: hypothetical protein Kow0031_09620 [Anaerolineae bacterium]
MQVYLESSRMTGRSCGSASLDDFGDLSGGAAMWMVFWAGNRGEKQRAAALNPNRGAGATG